MWINRETWQRVLLWNKRPILFALLFTLLFSLFPAEAQEAAGGYAFLKKGPFMRNSIELLSPNTYKAFWAEYKTQNHSIGIFFSQDNPQFNGVIEYCTGRAIVRIPSLDSLVYALQLEAAMVFFFVFPTNYPDPCGFINVFSSRFMFFWNTSIQKTDIPFPAVLQL